MDVEAIVARIWPCQEARVEVLGATECQALYKTYSDSYANPAIGALLHLTKVADLGK